MVQNLMSKKFSNNLSLGDTEYQALIETIGLTDKFTFPRKSKTCKPTHRRCFSNVSDHKKHYKTFTPRIPTYEPSRCSTRRTGLIKAYAANTN